MVLVINFKRLLVLLCLGGLLLGASYQTESKINIYYRQAKIKFLISPVNVNGVLYIPLRETAKELGLEWQYNQNRDEYTLIRQADQLKLLFRLNSRKIKVNEQWDELAYPVVLIKNAYFIPLNDFLWPLGYFVEKKQNDYFIVTKIKSFNWQNRVLRVEGEAPLLVKLQHIREGYELIIQDCILGMHEETIPGNDGVVQAVEIKQLSLSPAKVRVLVKTPEDLRYTALQEDDQNAYTLNFDYTPQARPQVLEIADNPVRPEQFSTGVAQNYLKTNYPKISEMVYRNEQGKYFLEVKADKPLNQPKRFRLKDPDRLVLDFPGVYLAPINILRVHDHNVQLIRGAQFDKGVVRIVLETKADPVVSFADYGNTLLLGFNGKVELAERPQIQDTVFFAVTQSAVIVPTETPRSVLQVHGSSLKGLKIAVIVGHGGTDAGALARSGELEKTYTLAVALKIKKLLLDKGAVPLLSRENDRNVSLDDQATFANNANANLLVSVHFNSFIFPNVNGAESYYYKPIDKDLAEAVHSEILKLTGLKNKGIKKAQMHNLNHTTMPGTLIEPLFISNRQEEAMLQSEAFQWKLAQGVVNGLEKYQRAKQLAN